MSITVLRTADAWWVRTPRGAARVETDATTTRELLAEPEKLHTAASSKKTVDPATLDLVSPGDGTLPGGGPDDELRQPREGLRSQP